jgi:hypothetical protein
LEASGKACLTYSSSVGRRAYNLSEKPPYARAAYPPDYSVKGLQASYFIQAN